ncbi:MAG: hypothetical protein R3F61_07045 [Myxococcota bacterium]
MDSTRLVRELGDLRAADVWARHDTLARALLGPHDGLEIDKTDGFLMIFPDVVRAVRYALAYHDALERTSAELGVPLTARAGIHVGEVILRRNPAEQVARGAKPLEVEGLAKPTAARVMSLAIARQTLLTAEARADLGELDLEAVSHGFWRAKGIDTPLEIFEVGGPLAPFTPPPDAPKVYRVVERDGVWRPVREIPTNVGPSPDAFFGRERALQELAAAMGRGGSLVTVTGPPRIGKARLALRYARLWMGDWPAGIWHLDARTGTPEPRAGRCLVILTHADRLSANEVAGIAARSPEAVLLVSRCDRLQLAGEQVIPLGPLDAGAAAALFEARARASDPTARVDEAHAAAVIALLDAHPGDVERAAVRSRAPGRTRPFLGLRSFRSDDSERFFGRDAEARSLAERVRHDGLVTVTGASGSGKTSLLQAGVQRYLRDFDIAVIRPGQSPLDTLVAFLNERAPSTVGRVLEAATSADASLSPQGNRGPGPSRPLLVVVDQAEEVLTLVGDPKERDSYGSALVALASFSNVRVAVVVREDFFARLAEVGSLKGRYHRSLEVVTRPDHAALLETLIKPAALFGHRFEDGLAERMVEEVAREPAALALLQFCADQLWERRDAEHGRLGWAAYEEVGGVTGALTVHADQVVASLAPAQRSEARRQILRLVTPQITKEPRARAELVESSRSPQQADRVLDRLIEARLLTTFESDDGTLMVELVHEALLRHWQQLREWLGEDEEGQRMTRSLRQAAEEWDRRRRTRDLLWRGSTLVQLEAWRERASPTLTALEKAFADTSARAARTRRRGFWLVGTVSALGLLGVAATSLMLWLRAESARLEANANAARAVAEERRARSAERAAETERLRAETERQQAVEASARADEARLEADEQRSEAQREAENARLQEGVARDALGRAEEEQARAERAAHMILDAQRLFAFGELIGDPARAAPFLLDVDPASLPDRWRSAALEIVQLPLTIGSAQVPASARPGAAMGPGGVWAIAGEGGLAVWDGGGMPWVLEAQGWGPGVAWSPDGSTLAVGRADGAVALFRRSGSGTSMSAGPTLVGHTRAPGSMAFSPDGQRLVTASSDGTARVWRVDDPSQPVVLDAGGAVWSAAFVEGGVLTASASGEVAVWDVSTGAKRWGTRGSAASESVATVAVWEPESGLTAAAWSNGGLEVLDATGAAVRLEGAPSYVVEAVFRGPDVLFTRGRSGDVSRWVRSSDGWRRSGVAIGMKQARDLEVSRDGRWLVVVGSGGNAEIWELGARGEALDHTVLRGHDPTGDVVAVGIDPTSTRVLTLGANGRARAWRARASGLGRRLADVDAAGVRELAYTPAGALEAVLGSGERRAVGTGPAQAGSDASTVTVATTAAGRVAVTLGDASAVPLVGQTGTVAALASHGSAQVATAGEHGGVRVWDLPSDQELESRLRSLPIGCIGVQDRKRYLAEDDATAMERARACRTR